MTVRPPTLRENRRYVLARVVPAGTPIDQKELYYAISDAVTSLWGDSMSAMIGAAVVAAEGDHVFIRCRRGTERELATALTTVTCCRDTPLALRILATSGTLESLRERIRRTARQGAGDDGAVIPQDAPAPAEEPREYAIGGAVFLPVYCDGQKIDVIEKGFKNTHRLFLTREDLENG